MKSAAQPRGASAAPGPAPGRAPGRAPRRAGGGGAHLQFLGAAGTVTGSRHLVDAGTARVLLDCGLFQGYKQLRLRNWAPFPVRPKRLDAVVLSHAHLDHSGYLPALVRDGFRGQVHCTEATRDLCELLLADSAHLQEEEARFINRHGLSRREKALPLYTIRDVERALERFRVERFDAPFELPGDLQASFSPAGHLIGAATVRIGRGGRSLVFSGDLGRPNDPILRPPARVREADVLLLESTYGDRRHPTDDPAALIGRIVRETAARGGKVIVPSFAVGRAQEVLLALARLRHAGEIPDIPIYLDSPMAIDATQLYRRHRRQHRVSVAECAAMGGIARMVRTPDESKALAGSPMPSVIIAGSGMATGGRVLHHLKLYLPRPEHHVMFVGYQAGGTRGAHLVAGAAQVKIHGQWVPVRAQVSQIAGYSAHADADEIIEWLGGFRATPAQTWLVHGEPEAADVLRQRLEEQLGWRVGVAEHLQTAMLPF